MGSNILFHPGDGWDYIKLGASGLSATKFTVAASSKGVFGGGYIYSSNASTCFLQVFDVALASAITVGSTTPNFTLPIAPGLWDHPLVRGFKFKNGCHIAFTTADGGNTGPGAALLGAIAYSVY